MDVAKDASDTPPPMVREVPRQGHVVGAASKHTPSALAVSERARADAWKMIGIGVALTSFLLAYLTIRAGRAGERVFVMDQAGNLMAGPLESMAESRSFFHLTALYATNTALQRSPEGFDLYELLGLYFTPRAVQKLEEDWERGRDDVRQRNLQQKPVIDSIGDPIKGGSRRIVEVRGRLISAGAYAGQSFYDELPYRFVLTFRKNPDLAKVGAYPWICEDFSLEMKEGAR